MSHRIIEVWDKIEYREGGIYAHVSFYGEEGINIGESNFSLDERGIAIYLCNGFQSRMTGQKLGEEIVARTFRLAAELSGILGMNSAWAFAYYFIGFNDERGEDYTGVNFEETEGFRILDSLFNHFGFRYVDYKASSFPDVTDAQLLELKDLASSLIPRDCRGGGWAMLLEDLTNVFTDENWWKWFYEGRDVASGINPEEAMKTLRENYSRTRLELYSRLLGILPVGESDLRARVWEAIEHNH